MIPADVEAQDQRRQAAGIDHHLLCFGVGSGPVPPRSTAVIRACSSRTDPRGRVRCEILNIPDVPPGKALAVVQGLKGVPAPSRSNRRQMHHYMMSSSGTGPTSVRLVRRYSGKVSSCSAAGSGAHNSSCIRAAGMSADP